MKEKKVLSNNHRFRYHNDRQCHDMSNTMMISTRKGRAVQNAIEWKKIKSDSMCKYSL